MINSIIKSSNSSFPTCPQSAHVKSKNIFTLAQSKIIPSQTILVSGLYTKLAHIKTIRSSWFSFSNAKRIKNMELDFNYHFKKLYKETLSALRKDPTHQTALNVLKSLNELWKQSRSSKSLQTTPSPRSWECYEDNWTYWMSQPELPSGLQEDFAFAVVQPDGTFDPNYPVFIPPWSTHPTLAIGGWNNSQSTPISPYSLNGFFTVVDSITTTSNSPQENTFLNSIRQTLQQGAWEGLSLDFENYGEELASSPEKYTKLVKDVYQLLQNEFPHVQLKLCISPNAHNRRYFDVQDILRSCPNIQFQVMFYDYALGQSSPVYVIPNAPIAGPEGREVISQDLELLLQGNPSQGIPGIPQQQLLVGVPEYGVIYQLDSQDPHAQDAETVKTALDNNWSLTASWYGSDNGQITNEAILGQIGDWDDPKQPWTRIEDKYANIFYYNASTKQIISAYPPSSLNDSLGELIRQRCPSTAGFFGWEAIGDGNGAGMKEFMEAYENTSSLAKTVYYLFMHIYTSYIRPLFDICPPTPPLVSALTCNPQEKTCFLDVRWLYETFALPYATTWRSPLKKNPSLTQEKIEDFLEQFFTKLNSKGIQKISFSSLEDLFSSQSEFKVGNTGKTLFEFMAAQAAQYGLQREVLFEGSPHGQEILTDDPAKTACTLHSLLRPYADSLRFSPSCPTSSSSEIRKINEEFFQELKNVHIKKLSPKEMANTLAQTASESCYIDLGILYGQWVYNNAIIWWPEPVSLNQGLIDEFLQELFSQLSSENVKKLQYSFTQMSDILNLYNKNPGAWNDTITPIYTDNFPVESTSLNFYEYMTQKASEQGFTNSLSFGGALAGSAEMTLPSDPNTCIIALLSFMKTTHNFSRL